MLSTPLSSSSSDYISSLSLKRSELSSLQSYKQSLEEDIASLSSTAAVGESLIDADQFPRSDIDVYSIRESRHLLIVKQYDYNDLMKKIEKGMIDYHSIIKNFKQQYPEEAKTFLQAINNTSNNNNSRKSNDADKEMKANLIKGSSLSASSASSSSTSTSSSISSSSSSSSSSSLSSSSSSSSSSDDNVCYDDLSPFLLVNEVLSDSPASLCGLSVGDKIVQYGSINRSNYSNEGLSSLTKASIGHPIPVIVQREEREGNDDNNNNTNTGSNDGKKQSKTIIKLYLTPKEWSGRGLLGCHLLPL